MDVRDPPVATDLAEQHRFDRAAVDSPAAIGSSDGLDARNPSGIACLTVRPTDERPLNGGAESSIGG